MGYPGFQTYVLKSHSLPIMWPVLVEFRSASAESGWRKKWKRSRKRRRRIRGKT